MPVSISNLQRIINGFYNQLDTGEAAANLNMRKAYERSLEAYDREAAKVLALIDSDGITPNRAFQYQRLQALAGQAADGMAEFGGVVAEEVEILQTKTGVMARESSIAMMDATLAPLGFASYATLPDSALRRMVGSLQNGSPLASLTSKYGGDSARELNRLLLEGISLGRSPLETARLMRGSLEVPYHRARTLVRTEQMRVFRETNRQTMQANRNVVKKWKWYAGLDRLTCPVCWSMHGRTFDLRESMDTHPNCRCIQIPVTASYASLGFRDINEPVPTGYAAQSRAGQLSNGFRFKAEDTYRQRGEVLFDSLPVADQRSILGKTAYKAYEQKLVKLSDFVQPTYSRDWGKGRVTRPLSQIIGRDKVRALQGRSGPTGGTSATVRAKPVTRSVPKTPPKPPAVTKPAPKAPDAWKPSMTREEAELWAKQGDLQRPLYHATGPEGELGISTQGFDLSRSAWGRVWGDGAYMSDSVDAYDMYSSMFHDPRKLELRVFSRKTLQVDISNVPEGSWGHHNVLKAIPEPGAEARYNEINRQFSFARQAMENEMDTKFPVDSSLLALLVLGSVGRIGSNPRS